MTPDKVERLAGAKLDRRMAVAFGLLILAIMTTMVIAVSVFYQSVLRREEDRLATLVSDVVGQAINRVSYSGRYHAQLLVEQLQLSQPHITAILIRKTDGTILAEAGPRLPQPAQESLKDLIVGSQPVLILNHHFNDEVVKEIVLPHRAGYGDTVIGTIHVGISFAHADQQIRQGLISVLALGLALLLVAMVITSRLSHWLGGSVRHMAEQLGGILEHAPLLIVIRDGQGKTQDASASYRALPAAAAAMLLAPGTGVVDLIGRTPVNRREVALDIGGVMRHFTVIDFAISSDRRGRVLQTCTIAADDTEQRRAERDLQERTAELERSNAELEQFAYVASHDLQEPLRMVASYVTLIERRYEPLLDQDGRDFIAFAKEGAERMQQLILDLLDYSRIGRIGSPKAHIDMGEALAGAIAGLQRALDDSRAVIDLPDRLPPVYASRSEMMRLWQNLIGNALKYAHPDRPPHIRITVAHNGAEWLFSVQDNGIGIEAQYAERIFMIFQRLHPRNRYPGSGIGLAICQKIVTQHGGRIWLDPQKTGALFRFTLPAA